MSTNSAEVASPLAATEKVRRTGFALVLHMNARFAIGLLILAVMGIGSVVLPLFALLKIVRQAQPDVVARTHLTMACQRIGSAGISVAGVYYLCLALTDRLRP